MATRALLSLMLGNTRKINNMPSNCDRYATTNFIPFPLPSPYFSIWVIVERLKDSFVTAYILSSAWVKNLQCLRGLKIATCAMYISSSHNNFHKNPVLRIHRPKKFKTIKK